MRCLSAFLLALVFTGAACAAGGYFRFPALHGDTLLFTAEGDLWKVAATGGDAQRLTSHPGLESHPAISPDGQWVAFTGAYEGPSEAYVMPLAGGVPRRLTWFGDRSEVVGWIGNAEVLVTTRYFHRLRKLQLVAISPLHGTHRIIALEDAGPAVATTDGTLVFTRGDRKGDNARAYRGGAANTLWRFRDGAEAVALTKPEANSVFPAAWKDRIVFASDRDGVMNLWSMAGDGGDLRQHTRHADFEVGRPAVSGDRVAYQHGVDLRLLDLAGGADRVVPIRLVSDFDHQREQWVRKPLERFTSASLSANGERLALVARGRAITAGIGNLRRVALGLPSGTRVRTARFMPDGKNVLVIADSSGETELWLVPADGSGPGRQLTRDADGTRNDAWPSPDGKWIAHHDRRQRLQLLEVATGRNRLVDRRQSQGGSAFAKLVWAPDGSGFAVEADVPNSERTQVVLYRASDAKAFPVASPRYASSSPSFSPDGKWLWFLAQRNFEALVGSPWGDRNMGPHFDKRVRAYAVALQPGNRFPFQPKDELEAPKPEPAKADPSRPEPARIEPPRLEPPRPPEPGKVDPARTEPRRVEPEPAPPRGGDGQDVPPVADPPAAATAAAGTSTATARTQLAKLPAIAWEGLDKRLHEVPLPAGNYTALTSDGKRLWFLEAETSPERKAALKSLAIDNAGVPSELFSADVRQFELSADGKKLFFRKWAPGPNPGDLYIVDPTPRPPQELPRFQVRLADWQFAVQPRDEWKQYFADAWRMHRDWFYDAKLHGVDWTAMRRKYEALLPRVTERSELADLMGQMSAELSLLHSQIGVGEVRRGEDNILPATLGAAYEKVEGGVRITRIYRADPELVADLPPLARTEVGVKAGDVLVAIDGTPVREVADVFSALREKAGRQVLLELRTPGRAARKAIATPAPAVRENAFKLRDWEWHKRERVEAASKGRFGYLYLGAMGPGDLATFAREFYPVVDREGLVIDVRDNNGGNIDSILIEKLLRRAWAYWQGPNGARARNMQDSFRGHIVVLIDEGTYSDGETFSEGMKRLGLATLVGKRTAGAGVWLSDSNRLVDGGVARAAEFGQVGLDGAWLIEGTGVTPDVEVENLPHASFKGEDAQLAAALRILEEKLKEKPLVEPTSREYPRLKR